eukprot:scaffold656694_cov33-Prasinocladus_malaysianus.AAC.1
MIQQIPQTDARMAEIQWPQPQLLSQSFIIRQTGSLRQLAKFDFQRTFSRIVCRLSLAVDRADGLNGVAEHLATDGCKFPADSA